MKSRETKVLVSFFLLYLGISGLPALMSLSAFSRPIVVSHIASAGGGKHPLRIMPSSGLQNITAIQAHSTVTPTTTAAIATPTVSAGAVVSTKSQIQASSQVNILGTGALFHQTNSPSLPRNLPPAVPTRVPEAPTPAHSVKVVPTLTSEPKVTATTTPTPLPLPTNVVPVDSTPIVPATPVVGQNIVSGGHS